MSLKWNLYGETKTYNVCSPNSNQSHPCWGPQVSHTPPEIKAGMLHSMGNLIQTYVTILSSKRFRIKLISEFAFEIKRVFSSVTFIASYYICWTLNDYFVLFISSDTHMAAVTSLSVSGAHEHGHEAPAVDRGRTHLSVCSFNLIQSVFQQSQLRYST